MRLTVDQSLAAGFILINSRQQRASLSFKPGVLEWNDDLTFFSELTFAKSSYDNVLHPSPLRGSGCNTLPYSGLANVNTRKRRFYPVTSASSDSILLAVLSVSGCIRALTQIFH